MSLTKLVESCIERWTARARRWLSIVVNSRVSSPPPWLGRTIRPSRLQPTIMEVLTQARPEPQVRDLLIPGTHDSGTETIPDWQPFSAVGKTQNCNVHGQLQAGARYLDLRVATTKGDPNGISICHGFLQGGKLKDILQQIVAF